MPFDKLHKMGTPVNNPTTEIKSEGEKDLIQISQLEHARTEGHEDGALKGELADAHDNLEKDLTLWQNLKLYRSVSLDAYSTRFSLSRAGSLMVRCHEHVVSCSSILPISRIKIMLTLQVWSWKAVSCFLCTPTTCVVPDE